MVEQVNLFGKTKYETLINNYHRDRQARCNGKELSFVPSSLWEIPIKNKYLTDLIEDKAEIRLGDGCMLKNIADKSIDLIFTCPPYWKLEKYQPVNG